MNCELCNEKKQVFENNKLEDFELPPKVETYVCRCPAVFFDHLQYVKDNNINIKGEEYQAMYNRKLTLMIEIHKMNKIIPADIKDEFERMKFIERRAELRTDIEELDKKLWQLIYDKRG